MHVRKIFLVPWTIQILTDLSEKQAEFNFYIMQSIWYFWDKVLSVINLKNFV